MSRRHVRPLMLGAAVVLGVLVTGPAHAASVGSVPMAVQEQCTASTRLDQRVPALDLMQSELAWAVTRGAGVTVAVVDSGVNAANPHLADAAAGGIDLVGGGDPQGFTDDYGHGTAIAGQIAARRIDGSGVEGLAPEARILSVRVFAGVEDRQVEAGLGPSAPRLAEGIRWAADQGAQIVNVSMSTTQDDPALSEAVAYAVARGSLVVASAGNRDSTLAVEESDVDGPRFPAGASGALGVAATDLDGVVTDASIHGPHVGVGALGQGVVTASAAGGDCVYAADVPATSFAAAYVSAAAALVAAAHPDETPAQWAYRLQASAVRANPDARDDAAGWGVVQPYEAIALIPGQGVRGPESPFPGAAGPGSVTPVAEPVRIDDAPSADAEAVIIGVAVGVGTLAVLGGAAAVGVLLTRRQASADDAPAPPGRGLYGEPGGVSE